MLVHLSRKSWHAKYYKWVKGYYPTYKFKSLCPYFWTLVFFILCFPLILLWKVITSVLILTVAEPIGNYIDTRLKKKYNKPYKEPSKFRKWWDRNEDVIGKWIGRIWIGFLIGLILFIIGLGIYSLFVEKGAKMGLIYIFAFIGLCTFSAVVGYGIVTFSDSEFWRIMKGMGYSVKNKACPMIKWDEPIKNEV